MEKTCFECRYADIDPGSPDVYYLPNGDPGDPGEPPCTYCQDPLADNLREYYCELLLTIEDFQTRSVLEKDSTLPRNVILKLHSRLSQNMYSEDDFAQFCPMFHQFDQNCKICGEIHHNRDMSLCNGCISKDPWI